MKFTLLVLGHFVMAASAFCQSISGRITDRLDNPISEVNIVNISNGAHAHSDKQGKFEIKIAAVGDTLQFSHIGFALRELQVENLRAEIAVLMDYTSISIEEVVISNDDNPMQLVSKLDIATNPVSSSQEILRKMPGLFIGQHAGGGKAEQIFLRGFDIDHGTDLAISVDGMPVNMVSHAHGQGYSDLHFVIPETIKKLDFGKGSYYADKGNFNTAGYVDFKTKDWLTSSTLKLEAGQFNTQRVMGMFNLLNKNLHNAYIATEHIATDGPFESSQNFNRVNVFGKYRGFVSRKDKIGFSASHFSSEWAASGQIPVRAVEQNLISRFGAIDDTEGGKTTRSNVQLSYDRKIDAKSSLSNSIYFSNYTFELFSNFTFFLEDSINGDQIKQRESRNLYGLQSEYQRALELGNVSAKFLAGVQLRNDRSLGNQLARTANRDSLLQNIQLGNINETNAALYSSLRLGFGSWDITPGLRVDQFSFQYQDALQQEFSILSESQSILSPKLDIGYRATEKLKLYAQAGKGFHSNDTRVVVAQKGRKTLPASYGFDLGYVWKPSSKVFVNMALWHLFLEQEFVYVGDAGIVEPSGQTQRRGVDCSLRYQPLDWLYLNADANYTMPRAITEPEGENFIPLAPAFTLTGGASIQHPSGAYGRINARHIADRPANEDNSIVADGYTVVDSNVGYKWEKLSLGIMIQNLLDTKWNETQFATESRLQNEAEPVEEIHFTPGTPFFLRAVVAFDF